MTQSHDHGSERRRAPTILVVDDSRTNLNVLGQRLSRLGYLVVLSGQGSEALDLIAARGFDLVLLDMLMPEMSGLEVLREIRRMRAARDLPVIMVTSVSDADAAVAALSGGADDYIAKPFEFEVLAARIARMLVRASRLDSLKRSNRTLDARVAARAIELGEVRSELAAARAELRRLQRAA